MANKLPIPDNWLWAIGALVAAFLGYTFIANKATGGGVKVGTDNATPSAVDTGCGCGA